MDKNQRKEDPVVIVGRLMATLYYFVGKEVVDTCGKEKGEELIRRAIWKFGTYRGKNIRKTVEEKGLGLNLENLVKHYDLPVTKLSDSDVKVTATLYKEITRYCTFAQVWKEFKGEDLGKIYCEQDFALAKAYNSNIECFRPHNIMDGGGANCELTMKL